MLAPKYLPPGEVRAVGEAPRKPIFGEGGVTQAELLKAGVTNLSGISDSQRPAFRRPRAELSESVSSSEKAGEMGIKQDVGCPPPGTCQTPRSSRSPSDLGGDTCPFPGQKLVGGEDRAWGMDYRVVLLLCLSLVSSQVLEEGKRALLSGGHPCPDPWL